MDRRPCERMVVVDSERVQPEERGLLQVLHERSQSLLTGQGSLSGPGTRLRRGHPVGALRDAAKR